MTGKSLQNQSLSGSQKLQRGLLLAAGGACVIAALSVPFLYESQTMWYKTGIDRILLRLGKMAGLLAVVFLAGQVIIGARGAFLERVFGVAGLMHVHRINGAIIMLLAICHVSLVLLPEGLENLPVGWKYWPEMIGVSVLLLIVVQTIVAWLRQSLKLNYPRWRNGHRVIGYLVAFCIGCHVLFVSDSFTHDVPKYGLLGFFGLLFIIVLSIKLREKK